MFFSGPVGRCQCVEGSIQQSGAHLLRIVPRLRVSTRVWYAATSYSQVPGCHGVPMGSHRGGDKCVQELWGLGGDESAVGCLRVRCRAQSHLDNGYVVQKSRAAATSWNLVPWNGMRNDIRQSYLLWLSACEQQGVLQLAGGWHPDYALTFSCCR